VPTLERDGVDRHARLAQASDVVLELRVRIPLVARPATDERVLRASERRSVDFRRHVAADGIVVAVVAISRGTGALVGPPELVARGFVSGDDDALFEDAAGAIVECIQASSVDERTDQGLVKEKVRVELRRFFRKRSGRRPFVLPVIMEI